MSASAVEPGVYFIADICVRLGVSRRVVERLRRHGTFPVPELPSLDARPRWSIAAVDAFLSSQASHAQKYRGSRRRKGM